MQKKFYNYFSNYIRPTTFIIVFVLAVLIRLIPFFENYTVQDITQSNIHLSNVDGFYYLSSAKALRNGDFIQSDTKRAFPDSTNRVYIAPLLSIFITGLSFVLNLDLETIGAFTPAFLGCFILIPLFFKSNQLDSTIFFLSASLVAVFSYYYLSRTSFGFLDTDSLNIFFPLSIATLFCSSNKHNQRYDHIRIASIFAFLNILFYIWWDQTAVVVFFLSFGPYTLYLLYQRNSAHIRLTLLIFSAILTINVIYLNYKLNGIHHIIIYIEHSLSYINKSTLPELANLGATNAEQSLATPYQILLMILPNIPTLLIAIVGIVILAIKDTKYFVYLLPTTAVGLLTFYTAQRFIIFLTPLFFLGFGYFFYALKDFLSRKYISYFLLLLFVSYFYYSSYKLFSNKEPVFSRSILDGMKEIDNFVDDTDIIWCWWDEGHPLSYYTDASLINDGMVHDDYRTLFTAIPLASSNPTFSSNFMKFYITTGTKNLRLLQKELNISIEDLLTHLHKVFDNGKATATDYLFDLRESLAGKYIDSKYFSISFYYPEYDKNLYLFLDSRNVTVLRWIYWFAKRGERNTNQSRTLPILRLSKNTIDHTNESSFPSDIIDEKTGAINIPSISDTPIPVMQISNIFPNVVNTATFPDNISPKTHNFSVEIRAITLSKNELTDTGTYSLVNNHMSHNIKVIDSKLYDSVAFQLFILHNKDFSGQFVPITIKDQNYKLWRIQ